jgi:hypothetical protein
VRGPRDVGVGQDGEELRRRAPKNSRRVHVPHSARQCGGHRLEGFVRWTAAVGLDQENAQVPLVAVSARQLVLEDGTHEAFVEESRRPIDDVERLGLGVVGPHSARRAEDRPMGQGRPASQACLSFRPPA